MLLCQEMQAATPPGVERHLLDTAQAMGMTRAAPGPPPGAASGSEHHTAVLVRPWLAAQDSGPAVAYKPRDQVPWAQALVRVPGLPFPVRFYSAHLPAGPNPRREVLLITLNLAQAASTPGVPQ